MNITVFEAEDWEHSACLNLQPAQNVRCTAELLNRETAASHAESDAVSVFVNSRLDAEVLRLLPKLRLIATRSTGFDHIDLDYCNSHGITVSNVPTYGDSTVAEHAFALLLALSRHVVEAVTRTRASNFSQERLRGFDIRGKSIGVIGTGNIGRRAIEIAKGFGMEVVAFDIAEDASLGPIYCSLDELLKRADVITIHVPATPESKNMISDREFGLMKPTAVLINTARGSVVDVAALVRALCAGKIAAAGLDVLPAEPLIRDEAEIFRSEITQFKNGLRELVADHVLLSLPNVLITPHIAYDTDGALRRILDTTLANIEAFAAGHPQNIVRSIAEPAATLAAPATEIAQ
jgi:D-lactate dehydrogenase